MFLEISTLCSLVFISFICLTATLIVISRHRHPRTEPLSYEPPETCETISQAPEKSKEDSDILELSARSEYERDEDSFLRDLGDLETALKETLTPNPVNGKSQTLVNHRLYTSDTNISSQIVEGKVQEDFASKENIPLDDVGEVLEKCKTHICEIRQGLPLVENVRTSTSGEINRSSQIVEVLDTCINHVTEIKSAVPLVAEVNGDHWDDTNYGISELSEGNSKLIETYEPNSDLFASHSSRQVSSEENVVKENANAFSGVTINVNRVQVVNTILHELPDVRCERSYSHLGYPSTQTHPLHEEIVDGFITENICHEVMDSSGNTNIENNKSEVSNPVDVARSCEGENEDESTEELNDEVQAKVEEWVCKLKNMFVPAAKQKEIHPTDDLHRSISNDVAIDNVQRTDEGLQDALDISSRYNVSEIPISSSASDKTSNVDKKRISRRESNAELETKVIFTESEEVNDTSRKEFVCIDDYLEVSSANVPAQEDLDKVESNSSISSIISESIAQLLDLLNSMDTAALSAKHTPEFHEAEVENHGNCLTETNSETENEIQEYEVTFDTNSGQESMQKIQLRHSSSMFEMLHLKETMKNVSAINETESNDEESYNMSEESTDFVKASRQTRSFVDPHESKNKVHRDLHQGWSLSFESRSNPTAGSQVFRDYWSFRENFQKKIARIIAHQHSSEEMKLPETDGLISDEGVDSSSGSKQNLTSVESAAMTLLTGSYNGKLDDVTNNFPNENLIEKCVATREQDSKDRLHDIGKSVSQNHDTKEKQNEREIAEVTQVGMSSSLNKVLPDTDCNLKHNDSIDLSRKSFEIGLSRAVKSDMWQDFDQKNSVFSLEKHRDSVELLCRRSFDSPKKKSIVDDAGKNSFAQSSGVHRTSLRRSSGSLGNHHDSADLISRRSIESRGNDDEGDKMNALENVIDSVELLSNKSNGTNNSDSNDNENELDLPGCEEVRKPHQVCWDLHSSIDSDGNMCSSEGIKNMCVAKNPTTKKKSIEFRMMHDAHGLIEIDDDTSMERLGKHSATSVDEDLDDNRSTPKSILKLKRQRSNVRSVSWKDLKNQSESQHSFRVDESDPGLVLEPKADRSSMLEKNSETVSSLVKPGCSSSDVGSLIRLFNGTKAFNEKRNANIEMETGDDFIWDLRHKFQDSDDNTRNYSKIAETENPADNNEMLLTCENLSEQLLAMTEKFHHVREHVSRLESYYEGGNGTGEEAETEEEGTEASEK